MPEKETVPRPSRRRQAAWSGAKQAALSVLFTTVLMIPRLRRLRRKVRAWAAVRVAAMLAGAWFAWRFSRGEAGTGLLVCGLLLLAFALLVRARPETKSVDTLARALDAWVALNGGSFVPAGDSETGRRVRIYVNPERLFVLDGQERRLAEIPLAGIRQLAARAVAVAGKAANGGKPWELEITWESDKVQKAAFRFEGFFAEHLARVAESTLHNLLRKDLPVLKG